MSNGLRHTHGAQRLEHTGKQQRNDARTENGREQEGTHTYIQKK